MAIKVFGVEGERLPGHDAPTQDAVGAARLRYADDVLAFRTPHSLAAYRPLGSLMRARLKTYQALSRFRHGHNRQPEIEPATVDWIPA